MEANGKSFLVSIIAIPFDLEQDLVFFNKIRKEYPTISNEFKLFLI